MSVGITVSIRYGHGGRHHVTRFRDISRLDGFLVHPAFIEGSDRYIGAYAMEASPYEGHGLVAPEEEGLVAIDVPSRRIVALEDHRTGLGVVSDSRFESAMNGGMGPHHSLWEAEAAWTTLLAENRVRLRVIWEPDFSLRQTTPGKRRDLYSRFEDPVSLETMASIPQARKRLRELRELDLREEPTQGRRPSIDEVLIDLSPWTIEKFPMTTAGVRSLRDRLVEMGFTKPEADEKVWREWEERAARDDGATEKVEALISKAPVIQPLDLVAA